MDTELREKVKKDYFDSPWMRLKFWFLARKIYRKKIASLWESNLDKLYFETQYSDILSYDDGKDRLAMAAERKKPLADQDQAKILELEERITHIKAVKDSYYKNERFRAEVKDYLTMLELWLNKK